MSAAFGFLALSSVPICFALLVLRARFLFCGLIVLDFLVGWNFYDGAGVRWTDLKPRVWLWVGSCNLDCDD